MWPFSSSKKKDDRLRILRLLSTLGLEASMDLNEWLRAQGAHSNHSTVRALRSLLEEDLVTLRVSRKDLQGVPITKKWMIQQLWLLGGVSRAPGTLNVTLDNLLISGAISAEGRIYLREHESDEREKRMARLEIAVTWIVLPCTVISTIATVHQSWDILQDKPKSVYVVPPPPQSEPVPPYTPPSPASTTNASHSPVPGASLPASVDTGRADADTVRVDSYPPAPAHSVPVRPVKNSAPSPNPSPSSEKGGH